MKRSSSRYVVVVVVLALWGTEAVRAESGAPPSDLDADVPEGPEEPRSDADAPDDPLEASDASDMTSTDGGAKTPGGKTPDASSGELGEDAGKDDDGGGDGCSCSLGGHGGRDAERGLLAAFSGLAVLAVRRRRRRRRP